ncbi:MAG: kelch repeat-containing protein [Candidatus Bathyarchaeia archaeon]
MTKHVQFSVFILVLAFSITLFVPLIGATKDPWVSLESMPTARAGFGVAVVDGTIYAVGGSYDSHGKNEAYVPMTNSWTTKKAMPTPRYQFGTAVVDNKIYTIGGDAGNWADGEVVTDINQVYDPQTDTWETKASMPTKRMGLSATIVDGKIYVIGGRMGAPTYDDVSVTAVYDPSTDTWTTLEPIPAPVSYHAYAVIDNKIYIIGGAVEVILNQIYDTETNTWSTGSSLPVGVDSAAAGVLSDDNGNQRIYVIGGKQNLDAVNLTQIYDPTTDTWTLGTSMSTARYGLAVAVVDNTLYAIGGRPLANGFPVTGINEQYTPSADVIPEFSSWAFLPVVTSVAVATFLCKSKLPKHQQKRVESCTKRFFM